MPRPRCGYHILRLDQTFRRVGSDRASRDVRVFDRVHGNLGFLPAPGLRRSPDLAAGNCTAKPFGATAPAPEMIRAFRNPWCGGRKRRLPCGDRNSMILSCSRRKFPFPPSESMIRLRGLRRCQSRFRKSRFESPCYVCDSTCGSTHLNNHAVIPKPAENLYSVVIVCSLRPRPQSLVYRKRCT